MKKRGFVNSILSKMRKKGLSTIVITLIIILISLVAVGIIWVVVRNVIQMGTKEVTIGQFTLDAKIKDVNIFNSSNNVSLIIKRNPGVGEFNKMNFVFSDGKNSEVITQPVSLKELEEKWFMFHLGTINVSNLISISIFPYVKQDEKEILGNILDKYTVSGQGSSITIPACTPLINNYCSIQGYVCGNWGNGTCFGNLNCGACGGATPVCNSSGRCVASCTPLINNYCSVQGYECGYWGNNSCSGNLSCGSCGSQATCSSGTCVCNSGWGDCNSDNTCECDLSSNSCSGGSCVPQTAYGCGNNLVESGEACDGTNMSGYTCTTVAAGYASGTLSCSSDCRRYITTSCVAGSTRTAATCSQTDVQNAINLANEGDTVNVPAGNCNWNTVNCYPGVNACSPVIINKSIFLKGAGIGKTNITSSITASYLNRGLYLQSLTGKPMRVSGFTFMDSVFSGAVIIQSDGALKNSRIDHNSFYNGSSQIAPSGMNGVIDYNNFYNSDIDISFTGGSQATASWASLEAGTGEPLFIENNNFIDDAGYSGSTYNEKIGTHNGGKLVIRYNVFDGTNFPLGPGLTFSPVMTHGSAAGGVANGYWQIGTGARRGQSVVEIYGNVMTGKRIDFPVIVRGSANLIYNNTVTLSGGYSPRIYMYEEEPDGGQWVPARLVWPAEDQVHNTFIWNNTYNGAQMNSDNIVIGAATFIQENRDYFLHRPATIGEGMTLGKETFTGANGASSSYPTDGTTWPTLGTMVFTPNVENAYYGYKPYPYPHPVALIP